MSHAPRNPTPPPSGPLPIRRLDESVINRIAAGEIIHRPASALKELIENSLDAGSTSIKVTVKDGGMKLLQIQDNGCGIRKADLPILAERFTTSKLSDFSDLARLTTYGFRGEALASISYVANLTVTTKVQSDNCAWKACYADGALVPVKPGTSPDPKACAGTGGTTIMAENLFYNTPTRLSALRSSSEEYTRILDVVTRYAIHNPHVSFTCKKVGSPSPDISTPSSSTTVETIRLLYGQTLAKELLHVEIPHQNEDEQMPDADDDDHVGTTAWSAEAYVTNANYHSKKTVFLLFINHRLVKSSRIRKALESTYNGILPKGSAPFMYLSLQIDPKSVDVNVHPTKEEVHFLDEDTVIERICDAVQLTLVDQSQSKTFHYQTLLTGGIAEPSGPSKTRDKGKGKATVVDADADEDDLGSEDGPIAAASQPIKQKVYSQHKVRTSIAERTLDSMFPVLHPSQRPEPLPNGDTPTTGTPTTTPQASREIKESVCFLKSMGNLRRAVLQAKHHQLSEILDAHTFVGVVDMRKCLSLIQHSTKLYLVNHGALAEELFYQLGLRQFGDFSRLKLAPPPDLRQLVSIAVDAEENIKASRLTKREIIDCIVETLVGRADMLREYFAMSITPDGRVETLPMLLRDYTPNLDKLPLFLMRLGPQVAWTSEQGCFDTFLRELAYFYVPEPLASSEAVAQDGADVDADEEAAEKATAWQIQHVLFPAIARYMVAPKSLLDRDVVQVANLPDLYRVFERC